MATITAKPILIDETVELGTIDAQLCGYGSRSPVARGVGGETGTFVDAAKLGLKATGPNNTYNFSLVGNDYIEPPGTYYTLTVRNDNGDILQCNAYVFLDDNTYDLANTDPIDPDSFTPANLPPLIINQLQILTNQPTFEFDGSKYLSFQADVNQNATIDIQNVQPGNLYTVIIAQDATGGHTVTWSPIFFNPTVVNPAPQGQTFQTFVALDATHLYPIGPATWY